MMRWGHGLRDLVLGFCLLAALSVSVCGAGDATKLPPGPERLQLLREAVAADPSRPLLGIELGQTCRQMGYPLAAREALDAALPLIKETTGDQRKQCIREYALAMAWLEYEAGNWEEGEAWGAKAVDVGAGQAGQLVEYLNGAAQAMPFQKFIEKLLDMGFMTGSQANRKANKHWVMAVHNHLHQGTFDEMMFAEWLNSGTKLPDNNVLRWRDFGLVCEWEGKADMARRFYAKSRAALGSGADHWVSRGEHSLVLWPADEDPAPFWMNGEGGYVTGSPFAYAEHAMDMLSASSDDGRRQFWAGQLLFMAGACDHRYPNLPWPRLWRGAALLAAEKTKLGTEELLGAADDFERGRFVEPRLNPLLGHGLLLMKKPARARPLLEQGVKDCPGDARCWGDLGIILAADGELKGARHAFDMALSLDRNQAAVWHNRGFLNLREGDWETALVDLQTAADLAPHDEQLRNDLQRVQLKVKQDRQGQQ